MRLMKESYNSSFIHDKYITSQQTAKYKLFKDKVL